MPFVIKGATSQFVHQEKFGLNFSTFETSSPSLKGLGHAIFGNFV